MAWVRIHPFIARWPGGGGPPLFEINSDENGTAVIELAWDPQALVAPATYSDALRYYSTDVAFNATITRDNGSSMSVSVPVQTITLTGNRAVWSIPTALWDAYNEETLKTVSSPPKTTFTRNLYYRVRLRPPGSATSAIWPPDVTLQGNSREAPHIGILPMSATLSSQVMPDVAAVQGLGGIGILPTLWTDTMMRLWQHLPESDTTRQSLVAVFAHPSFRAATLQTRTDVLRIWLFASTMRRRIPDLLSRQTVVGSGLTQPIISKVAARGGRTLAQLLLDLLVIRPHPDLGPVTRDDLIDDVLREILDPNGQINQGGAGTCVPTSIQTLLITVNPAEYVRLQTGLLSAAGRVELANGTTADVPRGCLQLSRYTTPFTLPDGTTVSANNIGFTFRTFAEMAFQSSMIKFGKGSTFPVDAGTEQSAQIMFATCYRDGLLGAQAKGVLDALFGVNFTLSPLAWPTSMPAFPVMQQAITNSMLKDFDSKKQQMLICLYWGQAPSVQPPPGTPASTFYGAHAVLALRREGGRLFFKNPQYAGSNPGAGKVNGGNASGTPPRRYDDVSGSVESMTESDLAKWIYFYLAPDTAII